MTCKIDGCDSPTIARGWCGKHYQRWLKYGDPLPRITPRYDGAAEVRFWPKVNKTKTCWLWTAATNAKGYGIFRGHDTTVLAYKFSYELVYGAVPAGRLLDHACRVRLCVNPNHLRPVTHKQNREHATTLQSNNNSGVHGVTWRKSQNVWHAQVGHNNKNYSVGYFADIKDAEAAVVAKRNELFTHNDRDRE